MSLFARVCFFVCHLSDIYTHAHFIWRKRVGGKVVVCLTRAGKSGKWQFLLKRAVSSPLKRGGGHSTSPLKRFQEEVQLRGQGVCSVWPQVTSRSDCCCKERCWGWKLLSLWAKSEGKIKTLENVSYCKRSRPWTMSENVSNLDQGWTMWAIARKCKCVGFPSTARLSAHETGEEWRFCLGHKIVSASPHCFPRKMGL